jgi:hypothetical protein
MVGANNIRSMPVVQLNPETTSQLLIQVEPSNQVHIFTTHPPLLNSEIHQSISNFFAV